MPLPTRGIVNNHPFINVCVPPLSHWYSTMCESYFSRNVRKIKYLAMPIWCASIKYVNWTNVDSFIHFFPFLPAILIHYFGPIYYPISNCRGGLFCFSIFSVTNAKINVAKVSVNETSNTDLRHTGRLTVARPTFYSGGAANQKKEGLNQRKESIKVCSKQWMKWGARGLIKVYVRLHAAYLVLKQMCQSEQDFVWTL